MPTPAIARRVAFDVLLEVADGGYASELLVEKTAALDSRDAGLASEITLGVLRRQGQLDWLIEHYATRGNMRLDLPVAVAIRMAAYQIRFLERVPAYAAVNDSLNLLRNARKSNSTGFANAILRKISAENIAVPLSRSIPKWLFFKWKDNFGVEVAAQVAEDSLRVPVLYQHVPPGAPPPADSSPTDVPGCWQVTEPYRPYRIQDIGSQAIVPLLDIQASDAVLDLCAAPGNKTAQILELTRDVYAADISFRRLHPLHSLGIPLVLADAAAPLPFSARFQRILVDAPCSGTGTLAHNPEIKWRLDPAELPRFADRQKLILHNALDVLAPGGTLVYSTCSLEPEENEGVVQAVAPGRVVREIRRFPGIDPGDGFYAAVIR